MQYKSYKTYIACMYWKHSTKYDCFGEGLLQKYIPWIGINQPWQYWQRAHFMKMLDMEYGELKEKQSFGQT